MRTILSIFLVTMVCQSYAQQIIKVEESAHFEFYTYETTNIDNWLGIKDNLEKQYEKYCGYMNIPGLNNIFDSSKKIKVYLLNRTDISLVNSSTPSWKKGFSDRSTYSLYLDKSILQTDEYNYYGGLNGLAANTFAVLTMKNRIARDNNNYVDHNDYDFYLEGFGLYEQGYRPNRDSIISFRDKHPGELTPEIMFDFKNIPNSSEKDILASYAEGQIVMLGYNADYTPAWNVFLTYFYDTTDEVQIKKYGVSEHFDIYCSSRDIQYIDSIKAWLERTREYYVDTFQITLNERYPFIMFYDNKTGADFTGHTSFNGGEGRACISPTNFYDGIKGYPTLVSHEYGHEFNRYLYYYFPTGFFHEGMAVYSSYMQGYTIAHNVLGVAGIKPFFENFKKTFGHEPTLDEFMKNPYIDSYGYEIDPYFYGCEFIQFLHLTYSYLKIKEFFNKGIDFSVFSQPYTEIESGYINYLKQLGGMEPLHITSPVTSDNFISNSTIQIKWNAETSIENVKIEYSINNGSNWTTISSSSPASAGSYNWTVPATVFGNCQVRISDITTPVVSSTSETFKIVDGNKISIGCPTAGIYIISNDTTPIKWVTNIQNVKIEYSLNNDSNWTTICASSPTSAGGYEWVVPSSLSGNCRLRITDIANPTVSSTTETFKIVRNNNVGGPYLLDDNTIALFHFDNDLNNRSYLSGNASGNAANITATDGVITDLGNCYKTTSTLTVPHSANLNLIGDWTIEAWIKFNSLTDNSSMYLLHKPGDSNSYESNYALEVNSWSGNVLIFGYYFSATNNRIGVTGGSVQLNKWYHIAFTRNTKNKTIQVIVHDSNRQLISRTDNTYIPTETYLNTQDLLMGTGLDGYIDEVRISNVVRTFVSTEINELKDENTFSVYPNPSNGIITITGLPGNACSSVVIYANDGRALISKEINNTTESVIDISSLNPGMYYIVISGDKFMITKKIIRNTNK